MKGSYLPDEAISRLGKSAPRLSRWIAPDPIRTPLDAVPLSGLTEVLATRGRLDDSLAAADEALRRTERSDQFCWMPEALRVKGKALLLSDKADTTPVEDHFRQSLDLARRRGRPWRCRTRVAAALVISPVQNERRGPGRSLDAIIEIRLRASPPVSRPDDAIAKNLRSVLDRIFSGVPQEDRRKMTSENAVKLFGLRPN
jgi:hypothetical protein